MRKSRLMLTALGAFVLTIAFATAAHAVSFRTHVSLAGNDANTASNCSRSSPCRNFAAAYGVTSPGGEIIALDSAGFGGLTITTAVTILAIPGQVALTQVLPATSGITVNAGAGDVVILKNLHFGGSLGANSIGVTHNTGKLQIEDCHFGHMATGLRVTGGTVLASRSSFTGNTSRGVHVSGTGKVDLEECIISNNGKGVTVDGAGGCQSQATVNPAFAPTTVARLNRGVVSNNTTLAFEMLNPGASPCGLSHGQNIYLRIAANGSDFTTNVPGYFNQSTNFLFVTGIASGNQILIGTYVNNNQSLQP